MSGRTRLVGYVFAMFAKWLGLCLCLMLWHVVVKIKSLFASCPAAMCHGLWYVFVKVKYVFALGPFATCHVLWHVFLKVKFVFALGRVCHVPCAVACAWKS